MAAAMLCAIYLLSREGAILAGQEKTGNKGTIVIDSGHGGIDPGVVGIEGLEEKGINLKIAGYLGENLREEGYKIVFTREDDRGLYEEDSSNKKRQDLENRCALIEKEAPLLTVSIHQNSYHQPEVRGAQVFYYQNSEKGKLFAQIMQKRFDTVLEEENRRQAKANASYYLLTHSKPVSIIVEAGFLSNPQEAERLESEEYQDRIAWTVAMGILQYLSAETD